jgi:hypothetical protein
MTRRIAHAAQIGALVLALALVPAALAAKGGHGGGGNSGASGSSSISLASPPVYDANGNGLPNWSDTVTFNFSTTAAQPYIHLVCGGNGVGYDSWKGVFSGSLDTNWNFILSSGGWTSGAADCTASLGMYTKQGFQTLASTSFHVDA